eukprot:3715785-Amphidinium_carterae.1
MKICASFCNNFDLDGSEVPDAFSPTLKTRRIGKNLNVVPRVPTVPYIPKQTTCDFRTAMVIVRPLTSANSAKTTQRYQNKGHFRWC